MSTSKKQLRLGAFLMSSGHHLAAWRYPDARADGGLRFDHYRQIVQTAERGKFDMIFFADGVAVRDRGQGKEVLSRTGHLVHFEPLKLVDLVIPELQRRGLFRTEYEGRTLRENLGLPRPENQFTKRATVRELAA